MGLAQLRIDKRARLFTPADYMRWCQFLLPFFLEAIKMDVFAGDFFTRGQFDSWCVNL